MCVCCVQCALVIKSYSGHMPDNVKRRQPEPLAHSINVNEASKLVST